MLKAGTGGKQKNKHTQANQGYDAMTCQPGKFQCAPARVLVQLPSPTADKLDFRGTNQTLTHLPLPSEKWKWMAPPVWSSQKWSSKSSVPCHPRNHHDFRELPLYNEPGVWSVYSFGLWNHGYLLYTVTQQRLKNPVGYPIGTLVGSYKVT